MSCWHSRRLVHDFHLSIARRSHSLQRDTCFLTTISQRSDVDDVGRSGGREFWVQWKIVSRLSTIVCLVGDGHVFSLTGTRSSDDDDAAMRLTVWIGLNVNFPGGRPEGKIKLRMTVQGRKYDNKFSEGTNVQWDLPKRMYVFRFAFRHMKRFLTMLLQPSRRLRYYRRCREE